MCVPVDSLVLLYRLRLSGLGLIGIRIVLLAVLTFGGCWGSRLLKYGYSKLSQKRNRVHLSIHNSCQVGPKIHSENY